MNEEALFLQALDKPSGAREGWLDEVCGDDPGLRRRLRTLLEAHENPGSFLTNPAPALYECFGSDRQPESDMATGQGLHLGPGSAVGPYRLLQKIGEGGM